MPRSRAGSPCRKRRADGPRADGAAPQRRNSSGAFFYRVRVSKLFDGDARLRERRISSEWQKM
ncbi:hypothetical protein T210_0114610 [Burkholderia pseudomallei MSHR6137]|nr:hypothetical protein T210_0114610 [Burkholderia pseudomallei MSHR6137]